MAEGDATVMNNFKEQLLLGEIDCVDDTFKVALYEVALGDPDGAAVAYTTDDEFGEANYDAGGSTVATPVVTQDDSNDYADWDDDGSDLTWSSLGAGTVLEARLYDDTASPKAVAILWEIATNPNGGDYTLEFGANGIMTLS